MAASYDGTNFGATQGSLTIYLTDSNNLPLLCSGTTVPSTGSFAVGCEFIKTNGGNGTPARYNNTGTTSTPNFVLSAAIDLQTTSATIATTSTTDAYVITPETGTLASVDFSGTTALTAHDTNFITWTITNLGAAGSGSTAMLATSPAGINTTKITGGTAIAANTLYGLTLSGTGANLAVTKGDRLLVRATASGTLANTVTSPVYMLRFTRTA